MKKVIYVMLPLCLMGIQTAMGMEECKDIEQTREDIQELLMTPEVHKRDQALTEQLYRVLQAAPRKNIEYAQPQGKFMPKRLFFGKEDENVPNQDQDFVIGDDSLLHD